MTVLDTRQKIISDISDRLEILVLNYAFRSEVFHRKDKHRLKPEEAKNFFKENLATIVIEDQKNPVVVRLNVKDPENLELLGYLIGTLETASIIGRGQNATVSPMGKYQPAQITFKSLTDLGIAVNALANKQEAKIDLSGLGQVKG